MVRHDIGGNPTADHNGGSRAMTVTSNRHAARLVFQKVSKPSAE
jgi:hypothetical protein